MTAAATSQHARGYFLSEPDGTAPRVRWAVVEQDALDMLTIASMLHRRLDQARRAPGAPAWQTRSTASSRPSLKATKTRAPRCRKCSEIVPTSGRRSGESRLFKRDSEAPLPGF